MGYYNEDELKELGFNSVGKNVLLSKNACVYNQNRISLGDNSRIDDLCILSGTIHIGSYCHITPYCLIAGGEPGVFLEDYCTLAYGVKAFSQSDDYSGQTMTNSLIPKKYKNEYFASITMKKFTIVGANSVILPGADLAEGTSIGAQSLVTRKTEAWSIYAGSPAKKIKDRAKNIIALEKQFSEENHEDTF